MAEPPEDTALPTGSGGTGKSRIPPEVAALLENAIKQGIDKALHAPGIQLPPPQENAIKERVSREVTVAFQHEISASYQGPLPPPEMLGEFERVVPGLGRQIAEMAAKEQSHRHSWERRALLNDVFMQSGALALGSILAGVAIVGAIFLGMSDRTIPMGILLSLPVLQMVRSIVGRDQSSKEPVTISKTVVPKTKGKRRQEYFPAAMNAGVP